MNYKIVFLTLVFLTLVFLMLVFLTLDFKVAHTQDCDCESNYGWVKKTFEENDAGFQYILEKKGQQAYDIYNALFEDKIKSAKSLTGCIDLISEWFTFFRSGHVGIERVVLDYVKTISTDEPYLEEINSTTLLLRIPSFELSQKTVIDSVIFTNKEKILKTENLIIDLRNNGGGSDNCFSELIPFIYTNPIRTIGIEYLSTKLNNQRMLDFATNPEYRFDEDGRKWAKNAYDKLEEHLNEFVSINSVEVDIEKQDTIYTYPKNIGILIHDRNASTTEQFLLAAKQSKKVKLFGTTTMGALDASNMYSVESPCKEFKLWYCLSKSRRIPDMAIDDIGIQPDYFIDKSIPDYKWVDFATEILNQK